MELIYWSYLVIHVCVLTQSKMDANESSARRTTTHYLIDLVMSSCRISLVGLKDYDFCRRPHDLYFLYVV